MRVFVTFPFSSLHDPMNCEYVAEVVRVEKLPSSKVAIAVQLMMTVNYGSGSRRGSISVRVKFKIPMVRSRSFDWRPSGPSCILKAQCLAGRIDTIAITACSRARRGLSSTFLRKELE